MNGSKHYSKLKTRYSILAIAVAFLLLALMIPNAVYAGESMNPNFNDQVGKVNSEIVADASSNSVSISGRITDGVWPIVGATVYAYQGIDLKGQTSFSSGLDGTFRLTLDKSIQPGDNVMLKVISNNYGYDIFSYEVSAKPVSLVLKAASPITIKPLDEQLDRHGTYTIEASIDGVLQSNEVYDNDVILAYNLPAGGHFTMSDRAHLYYKYTNSKDQEVSLHIQANGKQWYKAFWWGFKSNAIGDEGQEMQVNTPYILKANVKYTAGVWYQGLTMLDFSSKSEGHSVFDVNYVKNGAPYVSLQQASFQNTTYEGATCTVCDDGSVEIFFDDSDEVNTYKVIGYISPVAKSGYKFTNWTYNGQTLKAGDKLTAEFASTMPFVANYEIDSSVSPKTDDYTYIWVIALGGIIIASVVALRHFKKN